MTAERTPDARVEAEPYTPTTEQVRNNMAFGAACGAVARQVPDAALADAMRDIDWPTPGVRPKAKAQFDAWLAAHDAEVLATQPEGLAERVAEALDTHRLAPIDEDPDWTCRCGEVIAYAGLHLDLRPLIIAHQSAAVVAAIYGGRPGE